MKLRSIVRWVASTAGGTVLTPFLQAPATKLAETLHFDTTLSDRWGPLVQWFSDLTSDPRYFGFAGLVVGFALGMWMDAWLRGREESDTSALQATITDLRRQLDEPERQRRQAFENGLIQARAEFAVEMRKYLYGYNPEFMIANFTDEVLEHLSNHAVLFTHDNDISDMWRIFVDAFNKQDSILKIDINTPDPDGFVEDQINKNLNYFFKVRREAAKEIIAYLTYEKKGRPDIYKSLGELRKIYDGIGRIEFYDQASLNEVLAHRSRQGTAQETPP